MNIKGEHVFLRAVEEKDNKILYDMANSEETEEALGGWSFPVSEYYQRKWFERQAERTDILRCMIQADERTVGTVILSDIDMKNGTAQIHIKLYCKETGKGYGSEAVNLLTRYGFLELRLHGIYANVLETNLASKRMFLKCGFIEEGTLYGRIYKKGKHINIISYVKLRTEKEA